MHTNFELKKHNTLKIFGALCGKDSVSRKELAEATGLSWGSVSAITGDLIARGIIDAEKNASAGGRPADKLALSTTRYLQLGIDVNSVGLSFAVVNLRGEAVYFEELPIVSRKKDDLLANLFDKTAEILKNWKNVIGINLSMQGKINRKTGVSVRTNFFTDWKNVPLVNMFEKLFALPTKLYHDPDCLLYYHLRHDPRLSGANSGYVVRLDDGIGLARLINGTLFETGDDTSLELGHTISTPDGRLCPCGKQGCLESYASLRGMREIYAENYGFDKDFCEKLTIQDGATAEILQEATDRLGVSIANLFTLSSPEFILLDGVLLSLAPYCFEEIKKNTEKRLNDTCNLLLAQYKREAPAVGACLLTTEKNAEEILFHL
jgi:predicted NBD/HSP70 family sugar kinase